MFDTVIRGVKVVDGNGETPYSGDIAIKDGMIEAVGVVEGRGFEEIQAEGAVATPGWIDVHTHYDGQVSWDDTLDPSFSHGVTSVVMGNCGVGFAPAPPGGEQRLIELMEGVEDIPGTALYEGIEWGRWETFPEYLDYLESRHYSLNVAAQVPHSALRSYVMGDRALRHEDATAEDLAAMARIVEEAMTAGAVGFSTSRTVGHRSVVGETIPGTFAEREELLALAGAMKAANKGVFQAVPAGVVGDLAGPEQQTTEEEVALFADIAEASGRAVTFTLAQNFNRPDQWRHCLDIVEQASDRGLTIMPQIATRPIGFVTSLKSYHMFQRRRTYLELVDLPFSERLSMLKRPDIKARILADDDVQPELAGSMENIYGLLGMAASSMFPLSVPMNYEPEPGGTLGDLAEKAGMPIDSFVYDFLLGEEGNNFAISLGANFVSGNFDVIHDMLLHPQTTIGLSDAGAHVNLIFDAVGPTYQLMHWVRDRSRGPKLPIELIVAKQTARNADLFGLKGRGRIAPGQIADLNVLDLDRLSLGELRVAHDLPAGGGRILQSAAGYLNTFVQGVKTRAQDEDTGARPGRLLRA